MYVNGQYIESWLSLFYVPAMHPNCIVKNQINIRPYCSMSIFAEQDCVFIQK